MAARRNRVAYDFNQWSISRNGLATINFTSNVRDIAVDIKRQQLNDFRIKSNNGEQLISDNGEQYTVFNSDPKFNINQDLSPSELFDAMTVNSIREVLNTFRVVYDRNSLKPQLIQIISNLVRANPNRLPFVREVYARQVAQARANVPQTRPIDSSLIISNKHKYSKSDFDGMSIKSVLRSLFDPDFHQVFIYNNVLKGKSLPILGPMAAQEIKKKVLAAQAGDPLYSAPGSFNEEMADQIFEEESLNSDAILKHNTNIVLDILFKSRNLFYIDKRVYTILAYHQENVPTLSPDEGIEMQARSSYVIYPIQIYIELSELPPDKVTDQQLKKASCHIQKEKLRKDWFDIWYTPGPYGRFNSPFHRFIRQRMGYEALPANAPAQRVFERKFNKTLTKKNIATRGGKRRSKYTRKQRKKNGGGSNPPAAIIEYLEYYPLHTQDQVSDFYKKVDREWGDFKSGTNLLNIFAKSTKRVNDIDELLKAVDLAKKTTFFSRQSQDGDCEETADKVLEIIKDNPQGKYSVTSLRFEYYMLEDPHDPDEQPEFVQNHGFVAFYNNDSKDWFKTGFIKY